MTVTALSLNGAFHILSLERMPRLTPTRPSRALVATQLVWGSKRWLAYGYHFFTGDKEKAEAAYEACRDYDPARVDCVAFLSRLYLAGECDDLTSPAIR